MTRDIESCRGNRKKTSKKISTDRMMETMLSRQQFISAYILNDPVALPNYEHEDKAYNAFMSQACTFDPNDFHYQFFSNSKWTELQLQVLEDMVVNYEFSIEIAAKVLGRTVYETDEKLRKMISDEGAITIKTPQTIEQHEGKKYLRKIRPAIVGGPSIMVDVYCVCDAFGVTDASIAHAIKKLLCPGVRGKGDKLADLTGAIAALNRAVEIEQQRINDD